MRIPVSLQLPLSVHPMITVAAVIVAGQDVNDSCDSENMTPLMYASLHGHADTARVLIEKGARLEAVLNLLALLTQKYEY
jgi:ankyrin repeat protein